MFKHNIKSCGCVMSFNTPEDCAVELSEAGPGEF